MGQEVAIIFGRFNPPHKGHRAAWELAAKSPVWYVGTNESTVGPKDPLPYGIKVEAMTAIWPEVEGHIIAETSWLTLASLVYEKHGDVTLLCLTDEDWVTKTIVQYNGKEGALGFYNFKTIKQKPTPRLSSATALRDAVTKGDREAFANAAGVPADTPVAGKPFFDLVAEYLLPYSNAPVKKTAKKKVAAPVEGVVEAFSQAAADRNKLKYQKAGRIGHGVGWKPMSDSPHEIVNDIVHHFDNITRMVIYDRASERVKHSMVERFFKKYGYPLELFPDVISSIDHKIADGYKKARQKVGELDIKKKSLTTQKMPNDIIMLVHKLKKNVPLRPDEYQKLLAYKAFRKESMQTQEDAAGVGIITKQNSTVDVNKGTPRKNLKAFKLV